MDKANQFAMSPVEFEVSKYGAGVEQIGKAFGRGFYEGWGPERLGLSDKSMEWLNKNKVFTHFEDEKTNPFSAFGTLFGAAATVLDAGWRAFQGSYRGAQEAGVEIGLPKDVVVIPDILPFMHGMHPPTAMPKPYVKPTPIEPIRVGDAPSPFAKPRTEIAQTGIPHVDAIMNSEPVKSVIDNPVIDRSHTVPNSWSGSEPIENPTTYVDRNFPKTITVPVEAGPPALVVARKMSDGSVKYGKPGEVHADLMSSKELNADGPTPPEIEKAMGFAVPGGEFLTRAEALEFARKNEPARATHSMEQPEFGLEAATYNEPSIKYDPAEPAAVRENAEEAAYTAMIDGGMLPEAAQRAAFWDVGNPVEDAWYTSHGIDPEKANAAMRPHIDRIAAAADTSDVPPDMFRGMYPGEDPAKAGPGPIERPTAEESQQAREILQSKFVDRRAATVQDVLNTARDLDVIGPPKPEPTFDGSPSVQAEEAWPTSLSAASTPVEERVAARGHKPGEYDARGKEWVDKIDAPDDVRAAIEGIANENDWFPEARGGVASPAARKAVAEAAGVDPASMDGDYFAQHFDSDGKVRAVIQALRQTAKDVADAAELNVKAPSVENAAALAEAELRHAHVLEYTMGLRAESGRTLAAWKDLLREQEHTKATAEIRKKEVAGDTPQGTASVVDAVKEVTDNLKAVAKGEAKPGKLGIQKLIDQAKKLAEGELAPKEEGAGERAPISPEVKELTDAAKKVLKRFGADKDADLDAFRGELDRLSTGDGKLDSAVNAARELIKANERPPKVGEPKPPTDRAQLTAAAKRLVAAADKAAPEAKTPMPAKTRQLMEAARQAVGRLKTAGDADLAAFRQALGEGDVKGAQAAAQRLVDAEAKAAPGQPKPPVEHETVMAAARKLAKAGTEATTKDKATLPPDIKDLIDQASAATKELGTKQKSVLDSLIDQAEREAVNMTKSKAVKDPVEALPPELQALVDKTKRVVDRFGGTARPERAALLLARTGKTVAEQEQLARSVAGLTPNQLAKVLEKVRTSKLAEQPKWYYWLWQQGLISGLVTHSKYLLVNTAQVVTERLVSPVLSAGIGKLRGQDVSLSAPFHGQMSMIHQVPDAIAASLEAFGTGQRVPLASELRLFERGEESPQAKGAINPYDQKQGPDWGVWKRVFNEDQLDSAAKVLGIPGRSANMIHTFFKVLSERAAAGTIAAETAAKEGVTGDKFWERRQYHLDNPTDDALRSAVNDAYSGAFMEKLEGNWAKTSSAMNNFPIVGKWLFPFRHIPMNIVRKGVEYSPLAVLDSQFASALKGEKGAPAQNLALAKMAVGSSVLGYALHKVMADEATGEYPRDPKERMQWQLTGKQPFSVKMGNQWVAMERLGPIGLVFNLGASLGSIVRHYNEQDDATLGSAFIAATMATAGVLGNEAGFQSLRNATDAINGDEKKTEKFLSSQVASVVPSLLAQTASSKDPYQRKADDLISAMKYRVPWLRESLPVKRDPLYGEPLPNPGYIGNAKLGLFRASQISQDPVRTELDRLKIYPTQPANNVGGVKLPDTLYDKYQQVHGAFTRALLEPMVNSPGWLNVPPFARAEAIQGARKSATEAAKSQMQGMYPQVVVQGMKDQVSKINGTKPGKLPDIAGAP
jgi:hypothetical protein